MEPARWLRRWRRRLRTLIDTEAVDRELDEELAFHLDMETEKYRRAGMTREAARRQARLAFGAVRQHTAEVRDARWLAWLPRLSLDFKLGFRMLVKYPGLTLVGGLAMAFAIWLGAGAFEFVGQVVDPTLPLDEGDRVVTLRAWDAAAGRVQPRVLHDFVAWRAELRSVSELGAYRALERNLITDDGVAEPVEVAEISASAFRLTRVAPLLGRTLTDADERPEAPAAAVIGYDVWQRRFGGDPAVLGRTVRLGSTPTTVVGVMPERYAFPVTQSLWVPLRLNTLEYAPGPGPALELFGRLAPGATLAQAQAELATLGRRAAADRPETHAHLRPQVVPYALAVSESIFDLSKADAAALRATNIFFVMLLVLVCGNVALLMFARAATRESEILVRSALGASRGRIVTQLFAEALVLGGLAAALGLAGAGFGLRWMFRVMEADAGYRLPFWFSPRLSPATVLYVATLTLIGAAVAGVVPALKVTRGVGTRLRQTAAGGGGGLRFGGIWTAVIVSQVAVTVAFPMTAYVTRRMSARVEAMEVGFAEEEYLSARLNMDREEAAGADTSLAAYRARFRATYEELERRLAAEPGVLGITIAERLPRMYHPPRQVEVDLLPGPAQADGGAPPSSSRPTYRVSAAVVDVDYFDVLGAPVRSGRAFRADDPMTEAPAVIVNESFVDRVFGGRNPVGRRVRYQRLGPSDGADPGSDAPGPWHEILGVVPDLGMARAGAPAVAGIYHPLASAALTAPLHIAIHVRGAPQAFAPRLRTVAAAVDPALRLDAVLPIAQLSRTSLQFLDFWFRLTVLVSAVAMVLSLAGIYAVMSFTVARRTREIGIRVALGASAPLLAASIFARPLTQVGLGVAGGGVLAGFLFFAMSSDRVSAMGVALLVAYSALMLGVCLLACVVPTGRALRVEPTQALRAEV